MQRTGCGSLRPHLLQDNAQAKLRLASTMAPEGTQNNRSKSGYMPFCFPSILLKGGGDKTSNLLNRLDAVAQGLQPAQRLELAETICAWLCSTAAIPLFPSPVPFLATSECRINTKYRTKRVNIQRTHAHRKHETSEAKNAPDIRCSSERLR